MANFVTCCPACSGELQATRLSCTSCETQLEGKFDIPALLRLAPEDLAFATTFLRCSGSLKAVAELTKSSYPTVRNRLNEVIAKLEAAEHALEARRNEILDALESGKMSAKVAARELRKVGMP